MRRVVVLLGLLALPACGDFALETPDLPTLAPQSVAYYDTIDILGVGPAYEASLREQGIKRVQELLMALATRADRARMAKATGITGTLLLRWANQADLMRVTGVGPRYARLLEKAGVDTVIELSQRHAGPLTAAMRGVNAGYNLVDRVPGENTVSAWISNARHRDRVMEY